MVHWSPLVVSLRHRDKKGGGGGMAGPQRAQQYVHAQEFRLESEMETIHNSVPH